MPAPRSARRAVAPLSTAAIVDAALDLARTDGLAAVTMRAVADALDTGPMSLYRHVADRRTLLIAMLDEVAADVCAVLPTLAGPPRARVTAIMSAMHDAFRADPWVVPVIATEGLAGPRILPVVDALFGALLDAGLGERQAVEGYALLFQFTYGEAINHQREGTTFGQRMVRDADPDAFVHIGRVLAAVPPGPREFFAVNLDRLLDGLLDTTRG